MNIETAGLIALIFLCFSVCQLVVFRCAVRVSMRAQRGIEPPPIKSPVRAVKDAAENSKSAAEAKKEAEDLQALWDYDGRTPDERARYEKRLMGDG